MRRSLDELLNHASAMMTEDGASLPPVIDRLDTSETCLDMSRHVDGPCPSHDHQPQTHAHRVYGTANRIHSNSLPPH